ncbi:SDR family oxidoreductase [Paenibacillus guangzhouensis]|uniref:SDR family oxidoreductase n=1 Tax=Paenibacillus guangzhouensis TaxID=1473112 RepID=UPI001266EB8D|nr:SDR family oxidoreductase [Paenibacillus guangzhouensis]
MSKPLAGKIAVVAGGTRGAGRAIAVSLGEAGATVYVTGRSVRSRLSDIGRRETIDETAEMIEARGGKAFPVRVDHTVESEVVALFERVKQEQGRLDILVNDIWGGESLIDWTKPFWEHSLENGLRVQERAVRTHMVTSYYGVQLMIPRKQGLIIEITDGVNYDYRGNLYYSLAKISNIHLAQAMAADLKPHGIAAVSLTPGFLRSEEMLEYFEVTEANWQEGAKKDPNFIASETPYYIGRALVALASDPDVLEKTGGSYSTWGLSEVYDFTDLDGSRPHWGRHFAEHVAKA